MQQHHSVCRLILMGSVASALSVLASPALAGVCGPGNGDCCFDNGTPGCDDETCCELVCAADPFCCDTLWDFICVDEAVVICEIDCCLDKNDRCEYAMRVSNGEVVEGDSCGNPFCVSDGSASCGQSASSGDLWYEYMSDCPESGHGTIRAETCGSSYDTVLSVHADCPGDMGNEIICNDDFCGLQSRVNWASADATTYLIRVSGHQNDCGDFDLTLTEECGCVDDGECDDGDGCTNEFCVDGQCVNEEIDCDDGDPCTDDFCVADGECQRDDNGLCCTGCGTCDGDVNCDGVVDPLDLGAVRARYGLDPCNEQNCRYDVNCDGVFDVLDSGYILGRFGVCNEPDVCFFCGIDIFNDN